MPIIKKVGSNKFVKIITSDEIATPNIQYLQTLINNHENNKAGIHTVNFTTAPGVNDDNTADYDVGTIWIDTVLDDAFICVDSSTGSAIWKKITP